MNCKYNSINFDTVSLTFKKDCVGFDIINVKIGLLIWRVFKK